MIIRTRPRRIAVLLAFHTLAWGMTGYFLMSAQTGDRGLIAKRETKVKMDEISEKIVGLKAERIALERRVGQISGSVLDRDLLDERQREMLTIVHANDVVILTAK